MTLSIEDLRAAARVRAEAAAAGELTPAKVGAIHGEIPEATRQAILDDLASGVFEEAAKDAAAGEPDMTGSSNRPAALIVDIQLLGPLQDLDGQVAHGE
ncbi:MAG: hypothetical protein ACRDYC_07010 [Acidimicrobiales bacterium]